MGRRLRTDVEGGIHHVMNRGVDHRRIFFADADRVEFGRLLGEIHTRWGVETLAYCLMDNHYHLVLHTPEGRLSDAMQYLGLVYTRHTNDRVGRDGPIFRGRFASMLITTDSYLLQATRYVHRNVLDLPGVRRPDGYRWSSYRTYLGHRRRPPFLNTEPVLELVGRDHRALARFTNGDDSIARWGVDDLVQLVRFAIARAVVSTPSGAANISERLVLLGVLDRLTPSSFTSELVDSLDFPTATARRMAMKRSRDRAQDPAVDRIIRAVIDEWPAQFVA
jgi:REP element-mobilizing transposase RayT